MVSRATPLCPCVPARCLRLDLATWMTTHCFCLHTCSFSLACDVLFADVAAVMSGSALSSSMLFWASPLGQKVLPVLPLRGTWDQHGSTLGSGSASWRLLCTKACRKDWWDTLRVASGRCWVHFGVRRGAKKQTHNESDPLTFRTQFWCQFQTFKATSSRAILTSFWMFVESPGAAAPRDEF